MEAKTPLVSVIIPAYNAERYIADAICSVQKQTFDSWEIIVLDDDSSDATCTIVRDMMAEDERIRLEENPGNIGVAESRNRGISLSRGKYIAFLDADDLWFPEKLGKQIRLLEKANADLIYTSYDIIDENGVWKKPSYLVPNTVTYEELLRENVIGCSTVLLKRDIALAYNFDANFSHEDYAMWVRMLADGKKACGCFEVLTAWRYMENSRSFNKLKAAKNRWHIYRELLNLSVIKSLSVFTQYVVAGLKKYIKNG